MGSICGFPFHNRLDGSGRSETENERYRTFLTRGFSWTMSTDQPRYRPRDILK